MKKGYLAGKLFKDGDQKQRIYEKETLAREIENVEFFNPLTDNPANDKSLLPTAKSIFVGDTEKVLESHYLVAEFDDEDPGTMMEVGVAYGVNFILNVINAYEKQGVPKDAIIDLIRIQFPLKEILAHLSDIRLDTAGNYEGKYVPFGSNQYCIGGIELSGKVFKHFEDIVEYIKEKEQK